MNGPLATVADVRRALAGAPAAALGSHPPHLAGWRRDKLELCAECAGRILARFTGCGYLRSWVAVAAPDSVRCCGCGLDRQGEALPQFVLARDGREVTRGTELDCMRFVHQAHAYSFDHALRCEGYSLRRADA